MSDLKLNIDKLGYYGAVLNIIKQRDDNAAKQKQLRAQLREIEEAERSIYLDIDAVFEALKKKIGRAHV